jgi:peptidoglycan/xylan/chitin deacetylase (PgdA/CDA1 family)
MTGLIQNLVRGVDTGVASLYLSLFRERNALMPFLFHSLFLDKAEVNQKLVDPLQRTTVDEFRQFIKYYLDNGYRFVSPTDLLKGLEPDGKYALITFDDGYYNNSRALPVLHEFRVPAIFFISTDHVRESRCFWWDVLYRERSRQGIAHDPIYEEARSMKNMRTEEIEEKLTKEFGPDAFTPRGDTDRPFSPAELREFAKSPHVHLGNHTAHHAILTNYTPEQVRAQLLGAQQALRDITGVEPCAIAYPNGNQSDSVIEICNDVGLKIGFTVRPEKTRLPLHTRDPHDRSLLRIGRFATHGDGHILQQCRTYRSDLLLYRTFRDLYLRLMRGQVAQ